MDLNLEMDFVLTLSYIGSYSGTALEAADNDLDLEDLDLAPMMGIGGNLPL